MRNDVKIVETAAPIRRDEIAAITKDLLESPSRHPSLVVELPSGSALPNDLIRMKGSWERSTCRRRFISYSCYDRFARGRSMNFSNLWKLVRVVRDRRHF